MIYYLNHFARKHRAFTCRFHWISATLLASHCVCLGEQHRCLIFYNQILILKTLLGQIEVNISGWGIATAAIGDRWYADHWITTNFIHNRNGSDWSPICKEIDFVIVLNVFSNREFLNFYWQHEPIFVQPLHGSLELGIHLGSSVIEFELEKNSLICSYSSLWHWRYWLHRRNRWLESVLSPVHTKPYCVLQASYVQLDDDLWKPIVQNHSLMFHFLTTKKYIILC